MHKLIFDPRAFVCIVSEYIYIYRGVYIVCSDFRVLRACLVSDRPICVYSFVYWVFSCCVCWNTRVFGWYVVRGWFRAAAAASNDDFDEKRSKPCVERDDTRKTQTLTHNKRRLRQRRAVCGRTVGFGRSFGVSDWATTGVCVCVCVGVRSVSVLWRNWRRTMRMWQHSLNDWLQRYCACRRKATSARAPRDLFEKATAAAAQQRAIRDGGPRARAHANRPIHTVCWRNTLHTYYTKFEHNVSHVLDTDWNNGRYYNIVVEYSVFFLLVSRRQTHEDDVDDGADTVAQWRLRVTMSSTTTESHRNTERERPIKVYKDWRCIYIFYTWSV